MRIRGKIAQLVVLGFSAGAIAPSPAMAQDFDPAGRRHHRAPVAPPAPPTPRAPDATPKKATPKAPTTPEGAPPLPGTPPAGTPPASTPALGGRGPSTEVLIARYTGLVLGQPGAPLPLERLAQLYRERDGNLTQLVAEFEKRAATSGAEHFGALVALAALYQQDGRAEDAVKTYETAISERPKDPAPLLALARLRQGRGELAAARSRYDEALKLTPAADRETVLRALLGLSLDLKDFDAAKAYHKELVQRAQNSLFVRADLGRELLARGEYARAEVEFRDVVAASAGDNRTLAPSLRDLGRALALQHKREEALSTLKRALSAAGSEAGIRGEIFQLITELYRADNNLGELIGLLEAEHPADAPRLSTLGALYEETGQVDKALGSYKRALAAGSGRNIDTRLKVIHLYQAQGELEQAITEYEALIRAAPHNPDYVFELCETLIARGDRARALSVLEQLERRAASDEEILGRLADFYERVEERQRSTAVLARLAAVAPGDPSHLIDLGDRYFQQGDKKRALETWARIKSIVANRSKALALLGDVYLEHDMAEEALEALKEAAGLEPQNPAYRKAYAIALERTATAASAASLSNTRYEEARGIWEWLLARAASDKNLAREARTHIVTLLSLLHQLEQQVAPLERRLAATPPDLDAGRLLAEIQVRLRRLSDAEGTLRKVAEKSPGDADTFLSLERVFVLEHNLSGAIDVLQKLTQIDPKRAREFYQRMAQYAAELYRDDDAIRFASQAVRLSPDDAEGHRKLGEMYRKKQDADRAVTEFRSAIAKNDRLYPVYFELSEILLSRGEAEEADRLFRRVIRGSPDEELVSQAARLSMQINLGKGTLESLEQDLLPASLGNPRKPVYRRLLVELYGAMTFPLIQKVRHGQPAEAAAARAALAKIGARAVKPLLDALADEKEAQQRIAVDVLGFVENKSAGPALFAFATGQAEQGLRVQAMVACGSLRDPALLPKYAALLEPNDTAAAPPGDQVSVAAAWGVARLGSKKALSLLAKMLLHGTPEVRALAALGLGFSHAASVSGDLVRMARSADTGNIARAAAAFSLGELGGKDAVPPLVGLSEGEGSLPRRMATLSLARLGAQAASTTIADGVISTDPVLRNSSVAAALTLATRQYRGPVDPLPVPDGALDLNRLLDRLSPSGYSPGERLRAFVLLAPSFERAAVAAAKTSPDRAAVLAHALLSRGSKPGYSPFTDDLETVEPALAREAEQAAERIAAAVVPAFIVLERHPATEVRLAAVSFLATRREDDAQAALVDALGDPEESIQRAVLAALVAPSSPAVVRATTALLLAGKSWPLRVRAAEALARIGSGAAEGPTVSAIARAARTDSYALVREAAMRALSSLNRDAAVLVLKEAASRDPETRLRSIAQELLRTLGTP